MTSDRPERPGAPPDPPEGAEMPAEVRAVIEAERARPAPPGDVVARIRDATDAKIVGGGGPGGSGGAAGGPSGALSGWVRYGMPSLIVGLLAGVAIGVAATHGPSATGGSPADPESHEAREDRGRRAAAKAEGDEASGRAVVTDPEPGDPPMPPRTHPRSPSVPASSLGAERGLIERAQAAIARHAVDEARRALDEHARRFPDGAMAREREVLRSRLERDAIP